MFLTGFSEPSNGAGTVELVDNEAWWLRNFLANLSLGMKSAHSVSMHCDCQATVVIAKNKSFNGKKNRHICMRHDVIK